MDFTQLKSCGKYRICYTVFSRYTKTHCQDEIPMYSNTTFSNGRTDTWTISYRTLSASNILTKCPPQKLYPFTLGNDIVARWQNFWRPNISKKIVKQKYLLKIENYVALSWDFSICFLPTNRTHICLRFIGEIFSKIILF